MLLSCYFYMCLFYSRFYFFFFFSSRRRHTRCLSDWSSDVCSSDLNVLLRRHLPLLSIEEWGDRFCSRRDGRCSNHCQARSEERRVGKECRSRWWGYH